MNNRKEILKARAKSRDFLRNCFTENTQLCPFLIKKLGSPFHPNVCQKTSFNGQTNITTYFIQRQCLSLNTSQEFIQPPPAPLSGARGGKNEARERASDVRCVFVRVLFHNIPQNTLISPFALPYPRVKHEEGRKTTAFSGNTQDRENSRPKRSGITFNIW